MQHLNLYSQLNRVVEPVFSCRQASRLLVLLLVVMLAIYAMLILSRNSHQQNLTEIKQQQQSLTDEVAVLSARKAILEQDKALGLELASVQQDIQFRRHLLASLDVDVGIMDNGFAEHLSGLARQHIDGLWFTEIQFLEGGQQLALLGKTRMPEYVPQYIQKLAEEDVFAGHQFRVFRLSTPAEQQYFLEFELRANDVE